jgi:hypothetical protein
MIELYIVGFITFCVFAVAFYQSYRDKARWNRITSGMSLFGEREDIPPLVLEGTTFQPHERRVLIIWANLRHTAFETVTEARRIIEKEAASGSDRAKGARIFAWDGETWRQRK